MFLLTSDLRRPAEAALVAQIESPASGTRLYDRQSLDVVISVRSDEPLKGWILSLMTPEGENEIATGTASGTGMGVAKVSSESNGIEPGSDFLLRLIATDSNGAQGLAESTVRVPELLYRIIPLEAGELSGSFLSGWSLDETGARTAIGGSRSGDLLLMHHPTSSLVEATIPLASTSGQQLSRDGRRFYFQGQFGSDQAAAFLDVETLEVHVVALGARFGRFNIDRDGSRIVYERSVPNPPAGDVLQFFYLEEGIGEPTQITDDLDAVAPPGQGACSGRAPLLSADGSRVVLMTTSTLGTAPEDPSVGCRIFRYDPSTSTLAFVAGLPVGMVLARPSLSDDGRWLAFNNNQGPPLPSIGLPALLDLDSGELSTPVGVKGERSSVDSIITGDGQLLFISTREDLDPTVGNEDGNLDLFALDRGTASIRQVTDTIGGLDFALAGCPSLSPRANRDGSALVSAFFRFSTGECQVLGPQRSLVDGFAFRRIRIVRKRLENAWPDFPFPGNVRVIAGQTITLPLAATDGDGDPITFFAQELGGIDVPSGSRIEDHRDGTATFSWVTNPEAVGEYTLRVAAFDEGGGEIFHDVSIEILPAFACPGDCDGDAAVGIADLVLATAISLERQPLDHCPSADLDDSGRVTIDELVSAVGHALDGCSGS